MSSSLTEGTIKAVHSAYLSALHSSPVLSALAAELTGIADDDPVAALWIVHVVLSLAYLPLGDEQREAAILQRFISPSFDR